MAQSPKLYQPLDRNRQEIRLFKIIPSADRTAPVELELFTRDLSDAIADGFTPLSYVWGDGSQTDTIIINGAVRIIRQNLATFLRYAREIILSALPKLTSSCGKLYNGKLQFWADAICIDQDNVLERNHQVSLMRSIYGSAQVVICWLGQCEHSHLAIQLFQVIYNEWMAEGPLALGPLGAAGSAALPSDLNPNNENWMEKHPQFWTKDCEENTGNTYWNAVAALLKSTFWQRAWIVQEVALPKHAMMLYGSTLFHFNLIATCIIWMEHFFNQPYLGMKTYGHVVLPEFHPETFDIRPIVRIFGFNLSKTKGNLSLINKFSDLRASDPKDKIYGLLGLINTTITPDYQKSPEEVYLEVCQVWVNEVRDLKFLHRAAKASLPGSSEKQLPSWVPNWRAIRGSNIPENEGDFACSSGISMDSTVISKKLGILYVKGILCEEINHVRKTFPKEYRDFHTALMEWIENHVFNGRNNLSNGGLHGFQVLVRTLCWDRTPRETGGGRLDLNSAETHKFCIQVLVCLLTPIIVPLIHQSQDKLDLALQTHLPRLGLEGGTKFAEVYKTHIFPNAATIPQINDWTDAKHAIWCEGWLLPAKMNGFLMKRLLTNTLFTTKNGYIGLCISAFEGDVVAVVAGLNMPVILRRKDNHFEFVEVCFVLGLMDGEAVERVKKKMAKEEIIEIH